MKKIIFTLRQSFSEKNEKLLVDFGVKKIGDRKIEMILAENESIEDAINALARLGIEVKESHN